MTHPVSLLTSTGDARVDEALRATITAFEAAFPARVRGYYVIGSLSDGSGLPTSDLDLTIVFGGEPLADDEAGTAARLRAECVASCSLELDIEFVDEDDLAQGMHPGLKLGSRLVYGVDQREAYPLVPLDDWARDRLHSSCWRIIRLFGRPLPVRLPLCYPDAGDEFYGYVRRKTRLPDGRELPGTRDLIRSTGWAATGLLALRTGTYVARKRDCHRLYRERIGGIWAGLLTDIYERCRGAWHYLIPEALAERRELREICARTLGFENDFMAVYRDYLLAELRGATLVQRRSARDLLARVPWDDAEVLAALSATAD